MVQEQWQQAVQVLEGGLQRAHEPSPVQRLSAALASLHFLRQEWAVAYRCASAGIAGDHATDQLDGMSAAAISVCGSVRDMAAVADVCSSLCLPLTCSLPSGAPGTVFFALGVSCAGAHPSRVWCNTTSRRCRAAQCPPAGALPVQR